MNVTNRIYNSLLVVFMMGSIAQISATENKLDENSSHEAVEQAQHAQAIHESLDNTLQKSLTHLNDIDRVLEEFQRNVAFNGVKSLNIVNDKATVLGWIKEIRLIVKQYVDTGTKLLNVSSEEAEAFKIILVAEIKSVIEHIEQAHKSNFTLLTPYTPFATATRNPFQSLEAVENQLEKNKKSVDSLQVKMDHIGLTWYNKAYRTYDSYIIKPAQNHYFLSPFFPWIGSRTKMIGGIAALALYAKWKTAYLHKSPEELKTEIDKSSGLKWADLQITFGIRNWLDFPHNRTIESSSSTTIVEDKKDLPKEVTHPIGALGKTEYLYAAALTGIAPIGAKLYEWTQPACSREWERFCQWTDEKTAKGVNWLKGGAYKHQSNSYILAPTVTLENDVVGMTEAKEACYPIIEYCDKQEKSIDTKAMPELGFLFTGGSRTGKTFFVECLAGSIRAMYERTGRDPNTFNLISVPASLINQKGIAWIMEEAKFCAPCILFIDEIDLLGLQRAGDSAKLSEFLITLNNCFKNNLGKPIIVITATNRPQNLDFALRQRGRLGKEINFEYPKTAHRREFLSKKLDDLTIDSSQFDLDRLVIETENYSYEAMNALFNIAFCNSKREHTRLTQQHLDDAFDCELRKILFNSDEVICEQDTHILAAHIAGKALATELLCKSERIAKATILPYTKKINEEHIWESMTKPAEDEQKNKKYGRVFSNKLHDTTNDSVESDRLTMMQCLLAGFIAEELLLGRPSDYRYNIEDAQRAMYLAEKAIGEGVDIAKLPEDLKASYIQKALALKEQCKKKVLALLTEYRPAIEALRNALLEHKILTGQQVKQIIAQAMPNKTAVVK